MYLRKSNSVNTSFNGGNASTLYSTGFGGVVVVLLVVSCLGVTGGNRERHNDSGIISSTRTTTIINVDNIILKNY